MGRDDGQREPGGSGRERGSRVGAARRRRIAALVLGVAAAAAALAAQALTVRYNYAGNWTGLFHHGQLFPFPPELRAEDVHFFPDTYGYDGQLYHVMAHDPFLQRGFARYVDDPRLRYRRILLPALAHALGGGSPAALHVAYVGLVLLSTALGAGGLGLWAVAHARSPVWGALFLFVPATFVSLDRMTVDATLAALCVAFVACASSRATPPLFIVVVLATLVRETGLLFWTAAVGVALLRRDWRRAALLAPAVLPAVAWYAFVSARTPATPYPNSLVPLQGMVSALLHPPVGHAAPPSPADVSALRAHWIRVSPTVTAGLSRVALLGAALAIGMGLALFRQPLEPAHLLAAAFALLGVFMQRPDNWLQVYDFGRVYSPLLLVLAMLALQRRGRWGFVPLALMGPSMVMQTSRQMTGILRGLF